MASVRTPAQAQRARELVSAALRLVEQGGLDNLTMRRLAEAREVKLPTIYRIFGSKQDLINEMADAVLGAAEVAPDGPWQQRVLAMAGSLRQAILGQRDGARIVGGSYSAHPNTLRFADQLIAAMNAAGIAGSAALWSISTVFCYVLGETLEQQGADDADVNLLADPQLPGRYPQLIASPVADLADFDGRFDYGMAVIVAGLAAAQPN